VREASPIIGTAELFENERVKVWDFVLEPGQAIPMHTHRRDHVIVVIEGSDLVVEYGDRRRQSYSPKAGDVHYGHVDGGPADTHDARNVGRTRYRNLIVELKEPRRG
jgi:predicted metal-dependent enzyme (double-stranded beta helix superfamily)